MRPEVRETDYGAQYVKAGVESSTSEVTEPEETAATDVQENVETAARPLKRKGGRPKRHGR